MSRTVPVCYFTPEDVARNLYHILGKQCPNQRIFHRGYNTYGRISDNTIDGQIQLGQQSRIRLGILGLVVNASRNENICYKGFPPMTALNC